ncbi:MAG: oxygenase MpaB family protein [Propionibacteriales bacterium]|nr:oxygenase MpaB family protein [Propionibacteriales bacterium]
MPVGDLDHLDTVLLAQGASIFTALSGTANVVMQLSRPEIGYGVKDSVVVEGSLFGNPRRRQRTTVGLLAVAVLGTPAERATYRAAVNVSHARVPNAFDPELQRWVGACIYKGFEEAREYTYGPLTGTERAEFYRQGAIFGGMLQMPLDLWPATRDDFEVYWRDGLARARIDAAVGAYLHRVIRLEYLDRTIPAPILRLRSWLVTGYLPAELRPQLGLTWSPRQQRRFERFNKAVGAVVRRLPERRRAWPFTRSIAHLRTRIAAGEHVFGA